MNLAEFMAIFTSDTVFAVTNQSDIKVMIKYNALHEEVFNEFQQFVLSQQVIKATALDNGYIVVTCK